MKVGHGKTERNVPPAVHFIATGNARAKEDDAAVPAWLATLWVNLQSPLAHPSTASQFGT